MTMHNTLLLDRTEWDLVIDSAGNIAMATPPYSLEQDVACAIQTFLGELWYDTGAGIPYFENVLGHLPPLSLLISLIEDAAKTVSGVVAAQCTITRLDQRAVSGQISFIDENGVSGNANF